MKFVRFQGVKKSQREKINLIGFRHTEEFRLISL